MIKNLKLCFLAFAIVSLYSCNSTQTKKSPAKSVAKSQVQNTVSMPEYKGTIIQSSAEDDCEYVILLDGKGSVMMDPLNLTGNFKKHNTKVWFTFRSMKMANRCKKANPISIIDIRERTVVEKDKTKEE